MLAVILVASSPSPGRAGDSLPPSTAALGTWTILPNGPQAGFSGRHDDIYFIDPNIGWVVNGDGDVYRTKNGGDSWTLLTYTGAYNRCVGFVNADHGWIGMLYQVNGQCLLESTDSGASWKPVVLPEPVPHGICGMYVLNDSTICGVGAYYGYPTYIRTDDAGATWSVTDMSAYCGALVDTYWFDELHGIAVGSTAPGATRHPLVLSTHDGGATWSVRWTGTRDKELCWKISFVDDHIGYVSIENLNQTGAAYFLKTRDGGETWNEYLFDPNYLDCQGIGFVSEYVGWIGGWNMGTYITVNGGENWTWKNFGYNVNRIRFLSPYLGYACGRDVYKYVAEPSGVADQAPPTAAARLGQNTPNPFSAGTVIPYQVTEAGPVSLRLFDLSGRLVRELVSGDSGPGQFSTSLDASRLAAGTYYYQLQTPSGVETRKLQVVH